MKREYAKRISKLFANFSSIKKTRYTLVSHISDKRLSGFHQWADNRPCEGAFLFENKSGLSLWLVLIDWRESDNFYVVIFPKSKSGPIAEIHKHATIHKNEEILQWRYSPTKRDGKNDERKDYFKEVFLSTNVQISIPRSLNDVNDFIEEFFSLANSRIKADQLATDKPSPRKSFPEGKLKKRLHYSKERNQKLIRQAKLCAMNQTGHIECACCGFDFLSIYGSVGKGFIEAHHTKPISSLHDDGEETKIKDLALVCSNCHRMLHRKRPWLEMKDLKKLLQ